MQNGTYERLVLLEINNIFSVSANNTEKTNIYSPSCNIAHISQRGMRSWGTATGISQCCQQIVSWCSAGLIRILCILRVKWLMNHVGSSSFCRKLVTCPERLHSEYITLSYQLLLEMGMINMWFATLFHGYTVYIKQFYQQYTLG